MANNVVVVVGAEDKTGEVFNAVKKHLDDTKVKARETSDSLGSIGQSLMHGLQAAGIAIGLRQVYEGIKSMIEGSIELGMELGHLSEQTGISVQNLSVLKYMAEQTGVSFEVLSKGFKKLSTDIFNWEHGEKVAGRAFGDLGITMDDVKAKGQDMYAILDMVANKFQTMPNGPQKLAIAVQLFGRAGQQMIPILNQGAQGLEEFKAQAQSLGLVLDEAGVRKIEHLHAKLIQLKGAVEGGSLVFTESLAPALEGIASGFGDATRQSNIWSAAGKQAALAVIPLAGAVMYLATFLREAADEWRNMAAAYTVWDSAIGSKLDWTAAERKAAEARHTAALKELHDTHADHEAAVAEEKRFHDDMLALKNQVENPSDSTPTSRFMDYLHDNPGFSGPPPPPPPSSHTSKSAPGAAGSSGSAGPDMSPLSAVFADAQARQKDDLAAQMAVAQSEWEKAQAKQAQDVMDVFATKVPDVVLSIPKQISDHASQIQGASEKLAHGVFDPLFNFGEKWSQQWKEIRNGLLRDLGQLAESQIFGMLFGDPQGRGGKGLSGTSWQGNPLPPGRGGLESPIGGAIGKIIGAFGHHGDGVTSNGGLGAGAGAVSTAAASVMKMGQKSGAGGVQVILNNSGAPLQVSQSQSQSNGNESQVIQIMLKQLDTNGPVAQGIMGLIGGF